MIGIFTPIKTINIDLNDYRLLLVDTGENLHGYLVNQCDMYNSVMTYLSKNRDFSSVQTDFPAKVAFSTHYDDKDSTY